MNREEGFAGYGMKRDEYLRDCSDLDDVIAITGDGKFTVTKIAEKAYVGKDLRHIDIFTKNDENTTYNMVYQDGKGGPIMVKRFFISGITRDKVYDLTKGADGSRILYLGVSGPGNGPRLQVFLKPRPKLKNLQLDVNFNDVLVKNRSAIGNVLTKFPIAKIRILGADPKAATTAAPATPAIPAPPAEASAKVNGSEKEKPATGNGKSQIKLEF